MVFHGCNVGYSGSYLSKLWGMDVCVCACVRANLKLNILLRIPFQQHRKYVQYNAKLIDYHFACSSFYKSVIHRWMRVRLLFFKLIPFSWLIFSKWSSFRIVFSLRKVWYMNIIILKNISTRNLDLTKSFNVTNMHWLKKGAGFSKTQHFRFI